MTLRRSLIVTLAALIISLTLISSSSAQDTLLISYQGRLTDDGGNPITGTPSMTLTIYDGTGVSKWAETHPAVQVDDGLFSVTLGSQTALPDTVFNGEDRYLGITVGSDGELSPRSLLTSAPGAAYARRMFGDLTTAPGKLILNNPSGDSAVTFSSKIEGLGLVTSFKIIEPADDGSPIMEMRADGGTNVFTHRIIEPADDDKPVYLFMADGPNQMVTWRLAHPPERPSAEIVSNGIANTINFRLVHPPEQPAVDILSDAGNNKTTFKLVHPPEAPGVILTSDAVTNAVTFRLVHPPEQPIIQMSGGGDDGASIYMFNPQPEPPASNPILTMSTGADNGASIYMFNPQPEPPAQLFSLHSTPTTGASMGFFDDAGQVMGVEPTPFNSGFGLRLFNPLEATPTTLAEMTSTYGFDGASGRMAVYDPQSYLESELTPGNLRLQYRTGGMDGPALVLKADQATAKIGIGTGAPEFSLEMKSFGTGDGLKVNSSDESQLFRIRENSDGSCEVQVCDNAGTVQAMIRGAADTYFNGGDVGIGTASPNYTLDVRGTIGNNTTLYHSDRRWKKYITKLDGSLDRVLKLQGVQYKWRQQEFPDMNFPDGYQIGLIAQDVEQVIPEVVNESADGYKSIDYAKLVSVLIESIKEQQEQIETLSKRIEELEGTKISSR